MCIRDSDGLARVAEHRREMSDAVECCSAAAGLRARAGLVMAPRDQVAVDALIARLRAALGDADFDAAWAGGLARRLDDLQPLIARGDPAPLGV